MKNSRRLVLLDDLKEVGRALAIVPPRQDVVVPVSGLSGIEAPGGKCSHGMYIPATSVFPPDVAPYCSACRPYEIIVKKNGIFQA